MTDKIVKSDEEWRAQLTPEQYEVCRLKGTERPFTGELCALKEPGIYSSVCCGQALFEAATKFELGTGWPSFFAPVDPDAVTTETRATAWCAPHRSDVCALRRPFGSRLSRRPAAHGPALLHELGSPRP